MTIPKNILRETPVASPEGIPQKFPLENAGGTAEFLSGVLGLISDF